MRVKRAFTLVEPRVVIPVFAQTKSVAKKASALSNLKGLGTASLLYMGDKDDNIDRKYWDVQVDLEPYTESADVWADPASSAPKPVKRRFAQYAPSDDPARVVGTGGHPHRHPE